ncbi:MAG: Ni/Fe hydrogenase subunit alpha [Thermoproteota archaeon]|nr:MAG: Ni/Fe hydrogenase subunit alpha [Candidatus Korarchaeota archaeon]
MPIREVVIKPITRLEGHGKIDIFLDESGNVKDAFFQVVEIRGFERFCKGRPVEELPRMTPRICGVCPWAHHMASAKAADAVYKAKIPPAAEKLRRLGYAAFYMHDHSLHFYALAAPDFVVGPGAPKSERNVAGLVKKVGIEIGGKVLRALRLLHEAREIIGGKSISPVFAIPGGVSKPLTEEEHSRLKEIGKEVYDFARMTLDLFQKAVLENEENLKLVTGDIYYTETYYMGLVKDGAVEYYDGNLRVISPSGAEYAAFEPERYLDYIAEHVEPWSYLKFPYLKGVGWKGIEAGEDSGVYRVGPLARLNVASKMSTPIAQEAYEKMFETLGKPCHHTLAYHWARVIEIMNCAEIIMDLLDDPEILSKDVHEPPSEVPSEGIGVVEAPRGVLIHHYFTDENGIVKDLNLVVATVHNNAGINLSVKRAAQKLIQNGKVDDRLLNMVEMAFRAYDPCLACGTHAAPGGIPLEIRVIDSTGAVIKVLRNW